MVKNILIVEDSKFVNNLLLEEFSKLGYHVLQAFDLKEGVYLLKHNDIECIILDLHLPDAEGETALLTLKDEANTKVIILTNNEDIELRSKLFKHGIVDYILKDSNFSRSVKEVHKTLTKLDKHSSYNILIVDDSKLVSMQVEMILSVRGYNLISASNAKDALNILEHKKIHLMILDMELPDMHGLEVLERVKSDPKLEALEVLVLLGVINPEVISQVLKNGANDYIHKPFNIEEFVLKVDRTIDMINKDITIAHQNRFSQMAETIKILAHEWRQPLSLLSIVVTGLRMRVMMKNIEQEEIDKELSQLEKHIQTLSKTIERFRNYFEREPTAMTLQLPELLNTSIEIFSRSVDLDQFQVKVEPIKEGELYDVFVDANQVVEVFVALLKNASEQYKITQQRIEVEIAIKQYGSSIEVSFSDNGGGFSPDILFKAFEPYFSTKDEKNGVGLGLYFAKKIIEQLKGSITIDANRSKGARLIVTLPKPDPNQPKQQMIYNTDSLLS
jgi:DNA-binding response OmpR family regulator